MEFRTLRADEIECRVAQVTQKGCRLLLYKDARCDMNILDETVGPEKWQRVHPNQNKEFCDVSIFIDRLGTWVTKEDVGTESYTEKAKGQASDSFKRACFNWGIGRELYTAPRIWIYQDGVNIAVNKGKYTTYDDFRVKKIEYKAHKISSLVIHNEKLHRDVFTYSSGDLQSPTDEEIDRDKTEQVKKEKIDTVKLKTIKNMYEVEEKKKIIDLFAEENGIERVTDMDIEQYTKLVERIRQQEQKG